MATYTVLVRTEGTFTIEADSHAEAEAELDTYGEGDMLAAVEFAGGGFAVEEVGIVYPY